MSLSSRQKEQWTAQLKKAASISPEGARGDCKVDNCPNNQYLKGYCGAHYRRVLDNKSLEPPLKRIKGIKAWTAKERKIRIKTALVVLMGGKCAKCEQSFPLPVYDFHHVGAKTADIGVLLHSATVDAIVDEVVNCILLCANCHRLVEFVE